MLNEVPPPFIGAESTSEQWEREKNVSLATFATTGITWSLFFPKLKRPRGFSLASYGAGVFWPANHFGCTLLHLV